MEEKSKKESNSEALEDSNENEETDEELVEVMTRMPIDEAARRKYFFMKPTKAQVLLYFSTAMSYRLKRAGGDLQVCLISISFCCIICYKAPSNIAPSLEEKKSI